ncbi:hypothetical protein BC832DRAFT_540882 [Gaertneriomyces semiglobifer]|nr:hypothetical protein BC832DRAFT_540882 [Gaertneriomyces semiglobifer]
MSSLPADDSCVWPHPYPAFPDRLWIHETHRYHPSVGGYLEDITLVLVVNDPVNPIDISIECQAVWISSAKCFRYTQASQQPPYLTEYFQADRKTGGRSCFITTPGVLRKIYTTSRIPKSRIGNTPLIDVSQMYWSLLPFYPLVPIQEWHRPGPQTLQKWYQHCYDYPQVETPYELFGFLLKAERPLLLPGASTLSFMESSSLPGAAALLERESQTQSLENIVEMETDVSLAQPLALISLDADANNEMEEVSPMEITNDTNDDASRDGKDADQSAPPEFVMHDLTVVRVPREPGELVPMVPHSAYTNDTLDCTGVSMGVTAHSFPMTQDIVPRTDFERANMEYELMPIHTGVAMIERMVEEADQQPYPRYQDKHVALVDKDDYEKVYAIWDKGFTDALPYVKGLFDDPDAVTEEVLSDALDVLVFKDKYRLIEHARPACDEEEWKIHPRLRQVECSSFGNIRDAKTGALIPLQGDDSNYLYANVPTNVHDSSRLERHTVHRLVMEAFSTPKQRANAKKYGLSVDHIDQCNTHNNYLYNLRWATSAEQNRYKREWRRKRNKDKAAALSVQSVNRGAFRRSERLELAKCRIKKTSSKLATAARRRSIDVEYTSTKRWTWKQLLDAKVDEKKRIWVLVDWQPSTNRTWEPTWELYQEFAKNKTAADWMKKHHPDLIKAVDKVYRN